MKCRIFRKLLLVPLLMLIAALFPYGSCICASADSGTTTVAYYSGNTLISKSEYADFGQAWNAASASANSSKETVITVGGDYVLSEMLELKSYQHITIDLNGYCLRRDLDGEQESNGGLFLLNNSAVLTIEDSRPKSTGYDGVRGGVLADGASTDTGGCFEIKSSAKVYIKGGTIYNCTTDMDGGCVNNYGGTFNMHGGRIYFCRTVDSADNCHGGAIYVDNYGFVELYDCKIDNCYSEDDGGAIFSDAGYITCENVIFSGNSCRDYGGAICIWNNTAFEAQGCYFVNNYTEDDGGAVYVDDAPGNGTVILFNNCIFRGNKADRKGGALYVCDDTVSLSNTEMTDNTATKGGGAVYVQALYDISLRGLVTIKENHSTEGGKNLTLESDFGAHARVMSAGLYKGSEIYLSTTNNSGKVAVSYIYMNKYQMNFFFAEKGSLVFESNGKHYVSLVTSSIFSDGSVWAIAVMGTIGIVLMAAVIIWKKKNDKKLAAAAAGGGETEEGGAEHDKND